LQEQRIDTILEAREDKILAYGKFKKSRRLTAARKSEAIAAAARPWRNPTTRLRWSMTP
jgi:hypothetical protein